VTACLASAFFEDPLWGTWSFPDPATREPGLGRLMRSWAVASAAHGSLQMTPDAEAVAAWVPPGAREMTPAEELGFSALAGELFGSRASALNEVFSLFEQHHPSEPCWYLSLWGTHRDHAGHGLGTKLLRECLARIDAERSPAYLESTNPANLPRYQALGFRPRSQFGPPGGPVVTTMWRAA
jgi:hypothetical protein